MESDHSSNPTTVNIQDYYQTINVGRNVDTDRVMEKLTEMQNMLGRAIIATELSGSQITTTSEGIPVSETSSSPDARKTGKFNLIEMTRVFDFDNGCAVMSKTSSLLQCNKLDEALPIMKRKVNLGKDLLYARELAFYLIASMQSNIPQDMTPLNRELVELIQTNIEPSGFVIEGLADDFRRQGKSFESILLYLLAAELYSKEAGGVSSVRGIVDCSGGIRTAVVNLIVKKSDLKVAVKQNILPLFGELREKIQGMENVSQEDRTVCHAWCLFHLANIQLDVQEYEAAEESCKLGRMMMELNVSTSYMKRQVYGALLLNLGASYFWRQKAADAKAYWLQAKEVYNVAEDFVSKAERNQAIRLVKYLINT